MTFLIRTLPLVFIIAVFAFSVFYDSIAYPRNKQNSGNKNDHLPISKNKIEKANQTENEKTTYRKIVHFDLRSAMGTRRLTVRNELPAFVAFT